MQKRKLTNKQRTAAIAATAKPITDADIREQFGDGTNQLTDDDVDFVIMLIDHYASEHNAYASSALELGYKLAGGPNKYSKRLDTYGR